MEELEQADETTENEKKPSKDIYQRLITELRYDPDNSLLTIKTASFF
jgi:hypothetical protein